eukprot:scaffold367_cov202-Alexandrium_tamarense.AAC.20
MAVQFPAPSHRLKLLLTRRLVLNITRIWNDQITTNITTLYLQNERTPGRLRRDPNDLLSKPNKLKDQP